MLESQLLINSNCVQGVIDSTGTETFATKLKLAKLLQELKLMAFVTIKKVRWFF